MQTFTTSITLCPHHAAMLEQTARFYGMEVEAFLMSALMFGIGAAHDNMERAEFQARGGPILILAPDDDGGLPN